MSEVYFSTLDVIAARNDIESINNTINACESPLRKHEVVDMLERVGKLYPTKMNLIMRFISYPHHMEAEGNVHEIVRLYGENELTRERFARILDTFMNSFLDTRLKTGMILAFDEDMQNIVAASAWSELDAIKNTYALYASVVHPDRRSQGIGNEMIDRRMQDIAHYHKIIQGREHEDFRIIASTDTAHINRFIRRGFDVCGKEINGKTLLSVTKKAI